MRNAVPKDRLEFRDHPFHRRAIFRFEVEA